MLVQQHAKAGERQCQCLYQGFKVMLRICSTSSGDKNMAAVLLPHCPAAKASAIARCDTFNKGFLLLNVSIAVPRITYSSGAWLFRSNASQACGGYAFPETMLAPDHMHDSLGLLTHPHTSKAGHM